MTRRLYPERPLIGVGAVVWSGRRVLTIRRARPPRQGQWSIPGGLLEPGERLEAAVRREVLEETGIVLAGLAWLATVELVDRDPQGRVASHYLLIDYTAEAVGTEIVAQPAEVIQAAWHDVDDVPQLGMWEETERLVALALGRR